MMEPIKQFASNEREPALNWLRRQVRAWAWLLAWFCLIVFVLILFAQALLFLEHGVWVAQPAAKFGLFDFAKSERWLGWNLILLQIESLPIHFFVCAVGIAAFAAKVWLD